MIVYSSRSSRAGSIRERAVARASMSPAIRSAPSSRPRRPAPADLSTWPGRRSAARSRLTQHAQRQPHQRAEGSSTNGRPRAERISCIRVRSQRHANAKLAHPPADAVRRHAEGAGDGQHRRQQPHDAERRRSRARRKIQPSSGRANWQNLQRQSGIDAGDDAMHRRRQCPPSDIATARPAWCCCCCCASGEKTAPLAVFRQRIVLAVFDHARHLENIVGGRAIKRCPMAAVADPKSRRAKVSFTRATCGVVGCVLPGYVRARLSVAFPLLADSPAKSKSTLRPSRHATG